MIHPANGVTLSFPRPGEALVTAYGNFGAEDFTRFLADAFRVLERNTGQHPAGYLALRDGVIEVRVTTLTVEEVRP